MFDALLDVSRLDAGAMEVASTDVRCCPLLRAARRGVRAAGATKGLRLRVMSTAPRGAQRSRPAVAHRPEPGLQRGPLHGSRAASCRVPAARRRRAPRGGRHRTGHRTRATARDLRGVPSLEQDPARAGEGLGLGLSIVERLARLLDTTSTSTRRREGIGVRDHRAARAARRTRASGKRRRLPIQLGGVSVLIVDDDATVLDATRQQLERWGCRVRAAPSAVEACDPARPVRGHPGRDRRRLPARRRRHGHRGDRGDPHHARPDPSPPCW